MPFQKGQSGNPSGRKKRTAEEFDLIAAARQKAPAALAVIEKIMLTGDSDRVRLSAAMAIVERAYGTVTVQPTGADDPPPSSVSVRRTDASVPEPDAA